MDPRDPLGSLSDPYWKTQEEIKTEYDEQFNNGVREITVRIRECCLIKWGTRAHFPFILFLRSWF